ncbi:hypothetical protein Tco_0161186 [Tanacetum coccineum]
MALISLSFKKIYKPTNNNLRTSSNTSQANQDNSPRINRETGYDNQRAVNVAGARENIVPTGRVKVPTGRYVVPTGRVNVPAGRYVVPTGKNNVIVSTGKSYSCW